MLELCGRRRCRLQGAMDFAAQYRKRAEALELYLSEVFVKFEAERCRHAKEHLRGVFQNFDLDDSGSIDR